MRQGSRAQHICGAGAGALNLSLLGRKDAQARAKFIDFRVSSIEFARLG